VDALENDEDFFQAALKSGRVEEDFLEFLALAHCSDLAGGEAFGEDAVVSRGEKPLTFFDLDLVLDVVDEHLGAAESLEGAGYTGLLGDYAGREEGGP
jgi:hypothetical protein